MNDLISLATNINAEHEAAQAAMRPAVEHALRCGQLLADVKVSLSQGQFTDWINKRRNYWLDLF